MKDEEIARLRPRRQHLTGTPLPTPEAVVGWLGAVQAQELGLPSGRSHGAAAGGSPATTWTALWVVEPDGGASPAWFEAARWNRATPTGVGRLHSLDGRSACPQGHRRDVGAPASKRAVPDPEEALLKVHLARPVDAATRSALEDELERYGHFLQLPARLLAKPRPGLR